MKAHRGPIRRSAQSLWREVQALDSLHVILLLMVFLMAGVGWFAASQAAQAREETNRLREQYFKAWIAHYNEDLQKRPAK